MSKKTAVVICPGRGTYQKNEFGCLKPFYDTTLLNQIDRVRAQLGLETVSALDSADKYLPARHQLPVNNAALIYAAGLCQFHAINPDEYEVVAVTGNSMGWYTALSCAGVWDVDSGTEIMSAMAGLTANCQGINGDVGGQLIYPVLNEHWQPDATRLAAVAAVLQIPGMYRSIQYGGYAVLSGTTPAVKQALAQLPPVDERFPMQLAGHSAFHSPLMQDASDQALARFGASYFNQPKLPLIDGQGHIWPDLPVNPELLRYYTFQSQVSSDYDFKTAVQVAVREFAPDQLILLGPGTALGGAVAQSLIEINWHGLSSKADFTALQASASPFLLQL